MARAVVFSLAFAGTFAPLAARAASPCDGASLSTQCGWFDQSGLPPFVHDAIVAKGGVPGAGNVLVLTSGDPADQDTEISNDMNQPGCGTNPDGWETYDCNLLNSFVPPEDSIVLALSSEWFEWYQTIFTDWMTTAGAGIPTVDVSINSWIGSKVDVIPYGPWETGVVILTSLSAQKMVNFRVADSGDHIYDTAVVVVPATWFSGVNGSNGDPTLLCGDGVLEPGEDCDDGNNVSDDGCSTLCLGTQPPPSTPPPAATCGNLFFSWPTGLTSPYTCGSDSCGGFRCVVGNAISPACYTADQCASACAGNCVDIQAANLDCGTMCAVQPPANQPPPVAPPSCDQLVYSWSNGATAPYVCDDDCHGQRCVTGATVSPECFKSDDCDATTCPGGVCVDTPPNDCATFCANLALPSTCTEAEVGHTRPAVNQNGPCLGNNEVCKSNGEWRLDDNAFQPDDEQCNSIDDDCNGIVDDMFVTCGDPGLCQNTVNTCDPANPGVPVACVTLPPPSPVEICNNGLDDDCEGSVDDGCECGDDECMPGETYMNCPADCPPPPNGTSCDDGNFCTTGETWQGGSCTGGFDVVCSSDSACIVPGDCNPASGCSATKLDCNDNVDCTVDSCDAILGCQNVPDDFACNDDDPCTIDTCDVALGCTHSADPSCAGQDSDGDGYIGAGDGGDDCDDGNAAVHPGATEACNNVDDNCSAGIDEGFDLGAACQSGANVCGTTVPGVLVCSASGLASECGAVTPPDPAGYGDACQSAANSCGQYGAGTIGCDGTCSAVTPPNPAGYGDACQSTANACGQTGAGTISCDGTCSAVTPSNPAGYGDACQSAPNSCGQYAEGTKGCDGTCSAVTPSNPAGYGDACQSEPNACGQTDDGTIGCDGTCSAVTPSNPAGYGDACQSEPNACGQTGAGTVGCDGTCSGVVPTATDTDGDGTPDCNDGCVTDPAKTAPGACGCGTADTDSNANGIADCNETARADVAIAIEQLTAKPAGSKRIRYRFVVTNAGPSTVDPGATVSAEIGNAPITELKLAKGCTGDVSAITCTTPALKAGKKKVMAFSFVTAGGSDVTIGASVTSPIVDPDPSDNQANLMTTVP